MWKFCLFRCAVMRIGCFRWMGANGLIPNGKVEADRSGRITHDFFGPTANSIKKALKS